jgi:hypothetical protein
MPAATLDPYNFALSKKLIHLGYVPKLYKLGRKARGADARHKLERRI